MNIMKVNIKDIKNITLVSNEGFKNSSPDKNEKELVIPSNQITMKKVKKPILGIDNYGNYQLMQPDNEYIFPGEYVTEIPLYQKGKYTDGGEIDENQLFSLFPQLRPTNQPYWGPFDQPQMVNPHENKPKLNFQKTLDEVKNQTYAIDIPKVNTKTIDYTKNAAGFLGGLQAVNSFIGNKGIQKPKDLQRQLGMTDNYMVPTPQLNQQGSYTTDGTFIPGYMTYPSQFGTSFAEDGLTAPLTANTVNLNSLINAPLMKGYGMSNPVSFEQPQTPVNLDMNNLADNSSVLPYLIHQQGQAGINSIIKAAKTGEDVNFIFRRDYGGKEDIVRNMKNNVGSDFYKTYKELNPENFINYWQGKWDRNKKVALSKQTPYDNLFLQIGQREGIDPSYLKTIAYIESRFDNESNRNAKTQYKGLMQTSSKSGEVSNPFDPVESITYTAKTLKKGINKLRFETGGQVDFDINDELDLSDEQIDLLIKQGYKIEKI